MSRPRSSARDELLRQVIDWVAANGIGEISLRTLAEGIGTSHRMLLFHFGSKDELMAEVVRAVEADQRAAVEAIAAQTDRDQMDMLRTNWHALLDPGLRNNIRLFYEVYADALRGKPYTKQFLDEVMDAWLPTVTAAFEPVSGEHAATDARLVLALVRGLLLDLVTTEDTAGVDAAMQRFADLFTKAVTPAS
jgi:AcrR family transcriptional regulator